MITIDTPGMQENLGIHITFSNNSKKSIKKVEKPSVTKRSPEEEKLAEFGLKLMVRDEMKEEELMSLGYDLVLYVRKLIKAKKSATVRDFLLKHKDHLNPELRDLLAEELSK